MAFASLGFVEFGVRVAGLGSRGFRLAHPRVRAAAFFIRIQSQRETWVPVPHPTGLLTARVLVNSGPALPRVSTSPLVLRQSYLGLRVYLHTGSSQQDPPP